MKTSLSILSFVLVLAMAGCSGKSGSNKSNQDKMQSQSNEMTSNQSAHMDESSDGNTVQVYGIDQMKYVVANKSDNLNTGKSVTVKGKTYYMLKGITAQAGKKMTLKLTTISDLPASAMSHNWCLLKKGTDASAFAKAGASHKDDSYIAPKMKDQVIKETGMVKPGNSKTITFEVPEKTGSYEYICTFPGHYTSGMKGKLMVK